MHDLFSEQTLLQSKPALLVRSCLQEVELYVGITLHYKLLAGPIYLTLLKVHKTGLILLFLHVQGALELLQKLI